MVRAAPASIRRSTSPSSIPSALATSSCSSSTSRSRRRPVISCSACRVSRICSYAVRTRGPGAGATQAAATAWIACTSRSPPLASFRSGSSRKASSPLALARSSCAACSSARRAGAAARQSSRAPARSRSVRSGSPATCRADSSPSATFRSVRATRRACGTVRTAWSSSAPESQTGYQIRSAMPAMSSRPSCSSSTSRSLRGSSSRRPYPPTATRATSGSAPRSSASHRSTWMVRRARSAANDVMASTRGRCEPPSDSVWPALSGTHSDHRLDRDRPDLAVADPPGLRRLDHHADQVVGVLVLAEDLDAHLRHQVDLVLSPAVHLRVPALPAVSACFGDRQAVDAERLQRGLDVVQLERLDDSGDELHLVSLRQPVPRFRYRRFIGPVAVCQPRETPGSLVTAMFLRPARPGGSRGVSPRGLAQDRVDEGVGVEGGQIVRALAEADELDRNAQLTLDRDDDAALGRAVQLGQHDAGDVDHLGEHPGLAKPVLPGGGVEDQQHLVDRGLPFHHALDLAELVHEPDLGVQPPGGVD